MVLNRSEVQVNQSTEQPMAQLEEGWPLGLQPLNGRVGLRRDSDYTDSISHNTLLSTSLSSSTFSSSDLDTASTGSFFHERESAGGGTKLERLMGVSRSSCIRRKSPEASKEKKPNRWLLFSLCSRDRTDGQTACIVNDCPSLGHFLAVERRTTGACSSEQMRRKYQSFLIHGPDEFAPHYVQTTNTLFVDGRIAAPRLAQSTVDRELTR